jgi:urease accessory protein
MPLKASSTVLLMLMGVIVTPFAQAHSVTTEMTGLIAGVVHPLTGADHIVAAVAAGMWAALAGSAHVRFITAAFLGMLGLGAFTGLAGIPLSLAEPAMALSVITLGALVVLRVHLPRVAMYAVMSGFALFHGYAHAVEMPMTASAVWYAAGLLLTTSFLLISGIALGHWLRQAESLVPASLAGGFVALIGSLLLVSA